MRIIQIAIADDHALFRKGFIALLLGLGLPIEIVAEAENGADLMDKIRSARQKPDLIIIDHDMPVMDGHDATIQLKKLYPQMPVLCLTMHEREELLIRMLRAGANGILSKNINPAELKEAIQEILEKGYYHTDYVAGVMVRALQGKTRIAHTGERNTLSERELTFLEFACTDLTYKEIAERMNLSPKTIDNYREALFERFEVKSRVGLAMHAIRNGWVKA